MADGGSRPDHDDTDPQTLYAVRFTKCLVTFAPRRRGAMSPCAARLVESPQIRSLKTAGRQVSGVVNATMSYQNKSFGGLMNLPWP